MDLAERMAVRGDGMRAGVGSVLVGEKDNGREVCAEKEEMGGGNGLKNWTICFCRKSLPSGLIFLRMSKGSYCVIEKVQI